MIGTGNSLRWVLELNCKNTILTQKQIRQQRIIKAPKKNNDPT